MYQTSTAMGGDAWYALNGNDDDVFIYSKVCFVRNLADFPFPSKLRGNDGERIQSLVFDAFNSLPDGEKYQALSVSKLDSLGAKILQEREIMEEFSQDKGTGVVVRMDGKVSCSININDHVRLNSFTPGFDFGDPLDVARAVDNGLQNKLQFAASYDFGYLTSSVDEAGSGIKYCVRMHLPSLTAMDRIASLTRQFNENGLSFASSFGSAPSDAFGLLGASSASLGSYYDLKTVDSLSGTEFDQLTTIVSTATKIRDLERAAREECKKNLVSVSRNHVFRSIALARASVFVSLREAISLISGVKWGVDLGILDGLSDTAMRALLYRIQEGHLEFVLKSGNFTFEKDIKNDSGKKIQRLRAVILQEAFENIKISN